MAGKGPLHGATVIVAITALAAGTAAQQSAPTFDVASIRLVPGGPTTTMIPSGREVQPKGHFVTPGMSVFGLIMFAYDPALPALTLLPAVPDWATRLRFAVSAKAGDDFPDLPPAESHRRTQLMVRALLKDRFHLQLHTEARQAKVLKMSVDPGGLKLREVEPPATPDAGRFGMSMGDTGGRMTGTAVTMAQIAYSAGALMKQRVIDDTNLTGYYDLEITWSAPNPPGVPPPTGLGPAGVALFMSTAKERLGLRFTETMGTVDYFVVDHLEQPTEN